ncbi:unnamed protein product [Orchesella dallaii]|uniref:Uncharacterized protein n=1 Tax=Orchesella dallaii TaxID=48710 RepID=A0ABP1PN92_9HEXA
MKFQTCIRQSVQRCQINRNRKVKESGIGSTPRIIVVSSVPGNFRIIITRVRVQLHDGGGGPQEDIRCITSMCPVLLQEVYCSGHSSCYLLTVVNCTRMTVTCCYDIYHDGIAISKS